MDRGNDDDVAMRHNRAALESVQPVPRVLVDVSQRSQEITLFGKKQAMPIIVAPTGSAGLAWYEGEIALARAAAAFGIPFTLAAGSMTALERLPPEAGGTLWFQFYMWPDRSLSHQLIARAARRRLRGARLHRRHAGRARPRVQPEERLHDPLPLHPEERHRCAHASALACRRARPLPAYDRHAALHELPARDADAHHRAADGAIDGAERHAHLGRRARAAQAVARHADREGHTHARDAVLAADAAPTPSCFPTTAAACSTPMATINALPRVVEAVRKRITVIVDSGFRRGSDVGRHSPWAPTP